MKEIEVFFIPEKASIRKVQAFKVRFDVLLDVLENAIETGKVSRIQVWLKQG